MKHIAFALFTLHFSLFASPFAPDPAIEVIVHSPVSSSPLNVSTLHASPFDAVISRTFPASYTGHRAVCSIPRATTNDDFRAWIGGETFAPGDPYGCSNLRDTPQLDLTRTSAVFARLNVYKSRSDNAFSDRQLIFGDECDDTPGSEASANTNNVWGPAESSVEHVRVVPYLVAGVYSDGDGTDGFVHTSQYVDTRVVAEFDVRRDTKPCITEADFIRDGAFDIDWDGFSTSDFANNSRLTSAIGEVTAVKYRVIFGTDSVIDNERDPALSAYGIRSFHTLIERRFERTALRTHPTNTVVVSMQGRQPRFSWRLDEPTGEQIKNYPEYQQSYPHIKSAARYGCSYTAFQIEVRDSGTDLKVFDSGVLRAPARDSLGFFSWSTSDPVFQTSGNWKWRVAMYNSKFKPNVREDRNGWSAWQVFSTSAQD